MAVPTVVNAPYLPTEAEAQSFLQSQQDKTSTNASLPAGYPDKIDSSLAWSATEIAAKSDEQVFVLSTEDLKAVDIALEKFKGQSGDSLGCAMLTQH